MSTVLATGLIIMAIITPAFFCAGFYYGFTTAEGVFVHQAVTKENIPMKMEFDYTKQALRNATHRETEEERLARILAENVENYGTSVPQKEVV